MGIPWYGCYRAHLGRRYGGNWKMKGSGRDEEEDIYIMAGQRYGTSEKSFGMVLTGDRKCRQISLSSQG